jgi:hypothetical protein
MSGQNTVKFMGKIGLNTPGIRITRSPYEEPYHLNLYIEASNGIINGMLEYYCNADDLRTLGKQLTNFTGTNKEEIIYQLGSEDKQDRFAFFLGIRVMPLDLSGHCAVLIRLNNNQEPPDNQMCEFSIRADVADINRLGELLNGFGRLEHHVLDWRVQDGRLFKTREEMV